MNIKRALIAGSLLLMGSSVVYAGVPSEIDPVSKTVYESGIGTFNIDATLVGKLDALGITATEGDLISAVGVSWKESATADDYFTCDSFINTVTSGTVLGCLNGTNPNSNWDASQETVSYEDDAGNSLPAGGPVTTAMNRAVLAASVVSGDRHVDVVHIVHPAGANVVFNSGTGGSTTLPGDCGKLDCPDYPIDAVLADVATGDTVRFLVTKSFADGNEGTVEVSIACNTGLILEEGFEIGDGEQVEFVVENFRDEDGFWCEIIEDGEEGYSGAFSANGGAVDDSCYYTAGTGGNLYSQNYCSIVNTADFVDIEIGKDWVIGEGGASDEIDTSVYVTVTSAGEIEGGTDKGSYWTKTVTFSGTTPPDELVSVRPDWEGTDVTLTEGGFDSATEVSNSCGTGNVGSIKKIMPGDAEYSCTFTNTVFFEGIPTLSQYGMAIMALLMLGMGFVGFRRFA